MGCCENREKGEFDAQQDEDTSFNDICASLRRMFGWHDEDPAPPTAAPAGGGFDVVTKGGNHGTNSLLAAFLADDKRIGFQQHGKVVPGAGGGGGNTTALEGKAIDSKRNSYRRLSSVTTVVGSINDVGGGDGDQLLRDGRRADWGCGSLQPKSALFGFQKIVKPPTPPTAAPPPVVKEGDENFNNLREEVVEDGPPLLCGGGLVHGDCGVQDETDVSWWA